MNSEHWYTHTHTHTHTHTQAPVVLKVKREVTFSMCVVDGSGAFMFLAIVQTSQNTCLLWHHRLSTGILYFHFVKFPSSFHPSIRLYNGGSSDAHAVCMYCISLPGQVAFGATLCDWWLGLGAGDWQRNNQSQQRGPSGWSNLAPTMEPFNIKSMYIWPRQARVGPLHSLWVLGPWAPTLSAALPRSSLSLSLSRSLSLL